MNGYPQIIQKTQFSEPLIKWIRNSGVDIAVQTDGNVVVIMGLEVQAGAAISAEMPSNEVTAEKAVNRIT